MHLPERARPIWAWVVAHQPWSVLGSLLIVQWLALLVFALRVAERNGWLFYQGGDQTYYWTTPTCSRTGRSRSPSSGTAGRTC